MTHYWSWLLTAIGITGLIGAGKKLWWSWLIGLSAQGLWLTYALATKQYGFVVSALAYGVVYARNAHLWHKQSGEKL